MKLKLKLVLVAIGAFLSGAFYRMGGTNMGTKWRDIGVSVVTIITLILLGIKGTVLASLLPYFLTFLLSFAALTSYRYFLPKPQSYKWYHYSIHGFLIGISVLPVLMSGVHWYAILARGIVLGAFMGIWSHYTKWDILEEFGRGGGVILSLPLLLI